VPEDRKASGLVATMSVAQDMTPSSLGRLARHGYLSPADEIQSAEGLRDQLRIKCPELSALVTALSGGNQQKVVLSRGLMSRPRVLLMDEPTRGVDVAAKAEILDAMRRLAGGMALGAVNGWLVARPARRAVHRHARRAARRARRSCSRAARRSPTWEAFPSTAS
jgi:ABC-type sugar transport system ATPase subunit